MSFNHSVSASPRVYSLLSCFELSVQTIYESMSFAHVMEAGMVTLISGKAFMSYPIWNKIPADGRVMRSLAEAEPICSHKLDSTGSVKSDNGDIHSEVFRFTP